jgi:hypothetical protein
MTGWLTGTPEYERLTKDQQRLALEERVIKHIWDFADARPKSLAAASHECKLETGSPVLNFQWFHDHYPFPVQMGAAKIPWLHQLQIGDLFGPFTKLAFFKEYMSFMERENLDPATARGALVFPWTHIPKGGSAMVLHNYPVDMTDEVDRRKERGTRIIRPYGKPLVLYVIESLNDFLENVGTYWAR